MLATRARALLDGRLSPSLDDVAALAQPVLRHRMALNFSARADGVLPRHRGWSSVDATGSDALGRRIAT